jgi:protein involved in polysaccharide export with SLBB domain
MLPENLRSPLTASPRHRFVGGWLALLAFTLSGCAAFSNPVLDGIPVRRLPMDYLARPKDNLRTIPLTALAQPRVDAYVLGPGDILGVYIEGVVGSKDQPLPVREQQPIFQGGSIPINLPPAIGFPIPISADGTLPLPYLNQPLKVEGLTLLQTQELIRKTYVDELNILKPGQERILITLTRPRQFSVQVVRQETPQTIVGANAVSGNARRGTAAYLDLPAFQNDILNALTRTGGLPGLDSVNEIVVYHSLSGKDGGDAGTKVTRIPVRMPKDQPLPFKPEDVVLDNGDVVFIEARDTEVYYVGGLTIPRQYTLPRDYDLTVTEALAIAGGPLVNGGFNQNNLQGSIIQSGLGSPSPSNVTVIRRTKNGGQIKIIVNLNKAFNDRRENLILQPGDFLVLQETLGEALTRYLSTTIRYNFLGFLLRENDATLTTTYQGP